MSPEHEDDRLVTTSTRLLPKERKVLEQLAAQEERSVSQVARRLLRDQLSRVVAGK
jgi:hypothetical protein